MLVERMAPPATRHEWAHIDTSEKDEHTTAADHHGHGNVEQARFDQFVGGREWTFRDVYVEAQESARLEIRTADRDSARP